MICWPARTVLARARTGVRCAALENATPTPSEHTTSSTRPAAARVRLRRVQRCVTPGGSGARSGARGGFTPFPLTADGVLVATTVFPPIGSYWFTVWTSDTRTGVEVVRVNGPREPPPAMPDAVHVTSQVTLVCTTYVPDGVDADERR